LVIDEADRMVMTPGSFPELAKILDAVQLANPADEEENDMDGTASLDDLDDPERMLGLPGIPGEARVTMLSDDVLQRLQDMDRTSSSADEPPEIREVDDDEEYLEQELEEHSEDDDLDVVSLPALPPVKRQTFVFSATLTLPGARKKHGKKSGGRATLQGVDGAIAEIMEKARAVGQTTIVDLTNAAASTTKGTLMSAKAVAAPKAITSNTETQKYRLPPGLKLQQIKCTQLHKDSHLYAYLMTTVTGSAGPCLVFCNSIAAVRRVGATLQTLGIPVRLLHAHMQQVRSVVEFGRHTFVKCSNEEETTLILKQCKWSKWLIAVLPVRAL
jgi:ATP-dependent RNA helicase DDX24/MAK5